MVIDKTRFVVQKLIEEQDVSFCSTFSSSGIKSSALYVARRESWEVLEQWYTNAVWAVLGRYWVSKSCNDESKCWGLMEIGRLVDSERDVGSR